MNDTSVTFGWRDYRRGNTSRKMTLDADEFIRRFLLHSLPDGFHRIRHYGFLANGCRRARLALIRPLLEKEDRVTPTADREVIAPRWRPAFDPSVCPCCGGQLRIIATIPLWRRGPARAPPETS